MSGLDTQSTGSRFEGLLQWMYRPVDAASMAIFRVLFGGIMVWEVMRYFDHGWIENYYTDKLYYFTYPGFSWVHPMASLQGMEMVFIALAVLGFLVLIGLFYRFAAVGLFFVFSYIYLLEQARYLNHFYFVILVAFTMIFVPAHRTFSVDAWLRKRRGEWFFLKSASSYMDNWAVWAVKMQFGITYLYGGIAKLNYDWLRGRPLSSWISDETHLPIIGPYVHEAWMGLTLSYAGLVADLLFVPLLLYRRTRWLGLIMALGFNLMNDQLFSIGIFPWVMIAGTMLFMEPDWPKRLWEFYTKRKEERRILRDQRLLLQREESKMFSLFTIQQRALAALMVVFFAYQFLFPFRHWFYPGVVHWTEEGHMYSWHMKLRSKRGRISFVIKDPDTNRTFEVDPDDYLNSRQERKMGSRPTMILQFAHWLRDNYQEQGMTNVEVYADSWARLNGREDQRLIDPSVDLAKVNWRVWPPADWIVPLGQMMKE